MAVIDIASFRSQAAVTLLREGRDPVDISGRWTSLGWSSNAVGGFGSVSVTLPGQYRKSTLNYLDLLRVSYGPLVLFEGRVEDIGVSMSDGNIETTITGFGLARLLDDYSTRRIWSKRDIAWTEIAESDQGGSIPKAVGLASSTGTIDASDLTKKGVQIAGANQLVSPGFGRGVQIVIPGMSLVKILGTFAISGVNTGVNKIIGRITSSNSGATANFPGSDYTANGAISQSLQAGAFIVRLLAWITAGSPAALTPATSDLVQFTDLRLLGTSLDEDASGGFYGGTVLRDLIALVPDLTQGQIESGSDFTIQAIERSVRDSIRSVVNEVAGYYTREWAVWESGRFDWKLPNLDEVGFIIDVAQLSSMEIKGTVDGVARTVYVLYTDAASGLDSESSSASLDRRNPYVRNGRAKDELVRPGFPMTSNTSSALASQIVGQDGQWAPVTGTVSLPILASVQRTNGSPKPAFAIRGGDNIKIVGLPQSDFFTPGRNGESVFHVASSDVDVQRGAVRLTLEGQTRTSDQLLARLAAVTRTLTN